MISTQALVLAGAVVIVVIAVLIWAAVIERRQLRRERAEGLRLPAVERKVQGRKYEATAAEMEAAARQQRAAGDRQA